MTDEEEDEALTWAGGRDPSHYESPEPKAAKPARPSRRTRPEAQPAPRGPARSVAEDDDDLPPSMSAAVLLSLGVLVGIYGLYTIGWIISLQRFPYGSPSALDQIAFHLEQVLGILAPAIWFGGTWWLTRTSRDHIRLIWLVVGALLLVPWSFVFGI